MSTYERWLLRMVEQELPRAATKREIMEWLSEKGITDTTNCRRVVLSDFVEQECCRDRRVGKIDAMQRAAEHFGCSYETVRNSIYYKPTGSEK